MTEPTYSYSRILDLASPPDALGYRTVTIELTKDETACNPASTKRVIYGPCKLRYDIHPSGINTTILANEESAKPWQAEWDALKAHEAQIQEQFEDPYGRDNYAYDLAKKTDPEWCRLSEAFLAARRAVQGK